MKNYLQSELNTVKVIDNYKLPANCWKIIQGLKYKNKTAQPVNETVKR